MAWWASTRRRPVPLPHPQVQTLWLVGRNTLCTNSLVRLSNPRVRLTIASTVGNEPDGLVQVWSITDFVALGSDIQPIIGRPTDPLRQEWQQPAIDLIQVMQVQHGPGKAVELVELATWQLQKAAQLPVAVGIRARCLAWGGPHRSGGKSPAGGRPSARPWHTARWPWRRSGCAGRC